MNNHDLRRAFIPVMFFCFAAGVIGTLLVVSLIDKELPDSFSVEHKGKVIGYASTNLKTSEFLMLEKAKSPGLFIAFPVFSPKGGSEIELS